MLSYNLEDGGMLYLFDKEARESSKEQLYYDILKYLAKIGLAVPVEKFYVNIFNNTPAHTDDIHEAIIENKDVEVVTKEGGLRKKPNTIRANDMIKLADQKSFVFLR